MGERDKQLVEELKRRLAHNLSPREYRLKFSIPTKQPLVAKAYSESRKKSALERGQGDILVIARAKRAENLKAAALKTKKPAPVPKEAVLTLKASKVKAPAAVKVAPKAAVKTLKTAMAKPSAKVKK
jgi:hypothetical protein